MNSRIIVKIGTESLHDFENSEKVTNLIQAIKKRASTTDILLVTSGAVQFGRTALWRTKEIGENKQVLAGVGWHHLMSAYSSKFSQVRLWVAGYLVTHANIEDNILHANTLKETILRTWDEWLIPILNENDPISTEEMRQLQRWADNDKNALLLAKLFSAQMIVIITNTNGAYSDIWNPETRIQNIGHSILTPEYIWQICSGSSWVGTGWMASKLDIAHKAGEIGIGTHICDGINSWLHNQNWWWTTVFPDTFNEPNF